MTVSSGGGIETQASWFAGWWLARAALAPARSGPRIDRVGLNHAHQEIAQQLAFGRLERRQNLIVGGGVIREQTTVELFALGGEIDVPPAAVPVHDASLDQSPFLELRDDYARAVAVDAETRREPDLIEAGLAVFLVEIGQHPVLRRRQISFGQRIRNHRDADLIKPPRQRHRDAPDWYRGLAWQRPEHKGSGRTKGHCNSYAQFYDCLY